MTTKLCIDCKHCLTEKIGAHEFHQCMRPVGTSEVDGKPKRHAFKYCSTQRDCWLINPLVYVFGLCGKQARFFQPK